MKEDKLSLNNHIKNAFFLSLSKLRQMAGIDFLIMLISISLIYPFIGKVYNFYTQVINEVVTIKKGMSEEELMSVLEQIVSMSYEFAAKEYAIILFIFFVVISSTLISTASQILILGLNSNNSMRDILLKSIKKTPILFLASTFMGVVALLGSIPLIIPGIFILFLTSFLLQEILLQNKTIIASFSKSIDLIGLNLKVFVIRSGIITLLTMVASTVFDFLVELFLLNSNEVVFTVIYVIFSYFLMIFTRAYWILLYKNLISTTQKEAKVSKIWIYVFCGLGLSLLIYLLLQ